MLHIALLIIFQRCHTGYLKKPKGTNIYQKQKPKNFTHALESFTKYLRLTLVFMQNSTLREKINFCFSRAFF